MSYQVIKTHSAFLLKETLRTHSIEDTLRDCERELWGLKYGTRYQFKLVSTNKNTLELTLYNFNKELPYPDYLRVMFDHLDSLFIDRHGWFPAYGTTFNAQGMKLSGHYDEDWIIANQKFIKDLIIRYESKYDKKGAKLPLVYHMSIQEYEPLVLSQGLVPKSKSKISNHLDRIYVCADKESCYNLLNKMGFFYREVKMDNPHNKINSKWLLYELDLSDLEVNLYQDPNYSKGYYLVDNIPPSNITIVDREV